MILIDSRVGSKEISRFLPSTVPHGLTTLNSADFAFEGNGPDNSIIKIGIERKAINDLLQSITSKRLVGHQLPKLAEDYQRIYLLVEGMWRECDDGSIEYHNGFTWTKPFQGFMVKDLRAFLWTMQEVCGVKVIYSSSLKDTSKVVVSLYNWWNKDYEDHKSHSAIYIDHIEGTILSKPNLVMRVASQLPGVGTKRAKAVGRFFTSVCEMAISSVDDWVKIEGIGKKTAEGIVKAIRGE